MGSLKLGDIYIKEGNTIILEITEIGPSSRVLYTILEHEHASYAGQRGEITLTRLDQLKFTKSDDYLKQKKLKQETNNWLT